MPSQAWIRRYLRERGYSDDQIGWDDKNKTVTLQGQYFTDPDDVRNGQSFADRQQLDQALRNFRNRQRRDQSFNLGNQLNQRVNQPVQTVQMPEPYQGFDPKDNEAFQAAVRNLNENLERRTNNALVRLGRRGIGNSQSAVSAATQLQNQAESRIQNEILPYYQQQDYNRYRDRVADALNIDQLNYARGRDQFNDLQSVLQYFDTQQQQGFQNQLARDQFDLQRTTRMAELTGQLPDGTPTTAEQQRQLENLWIAAQQTGQIGPELAEFYGLEPGTPTFEAQQAAIQNSLRNRQLGISAQNAATSRMRANLAQMAQQNQMEEAELNRLFDIWERTGVAPEGIPGVEPGTPLYDPVAARQSGGPQEQDVDPILDRAVDLASQTPGFTALPFEERQRIVNEYYQMLTGGQSPAPSGGQITDEELQEFLK